jgi:hypothetical protein
VLDPNQGFGYPRAAVSLPPDPCRRPSVAVQSQHPISFDYGAKPHQILGAVEQRTAQYSSEYATVTRGQAWQHPPSAARIGIRWAEKV